MTQEKVGEVLELKCKHPVRKLVLWNVLGARQKDGDAAFEDVAGENELASLGNGDIFEIKE